VLLQTDLATARGALFEGVGLFEPARDGVLLHAQADDLDWFARELMRLPFGFEVRRPQALRTLLAARARRLLADVAATPPEAV
jgi:predicted DNA-binding transcriptional regulator YafY